MKKGFTLVELLAVIAIIAILVVFIVPNVLNTYSTNKSTLSKIQKDQIESATEMYINDYCINPISDDYTCPSEWTFSTDEKGIKKVDTANIALEEIEDYFDSSNIKNNCTGHVAIISGEIDLSNITCNFNK